MNANALMVEMHRLQGADPYQIYDLSKHPVEPASGSVCESKLRGIGYQASDFAGKTVLDLACHLGFFSFLALDHGARSVWSVDNNQEYIMALDRYRDLHRERTRGLTEHRISQMDLMSLPDLGSHDLVMAHAIIHWIVFCSPKTIENCMAWLASLVQPNGRVIYEGLWDASERFMYHEKQEDREALLAKMNPVRFIQAAERSFGHVRFVGGCSYNPKRVVIEMRP